MCATAPGVQSVGRDGALPDLTCWVCSVHAAREVSVRELLDGQQQGGLPESVRITYQSLRLVLADWSGTALIRVCSAVGRSLL